ncbi:MAG: hypothetical protein ACE5PV_25125, partial [Candidatus Poribacteria bacterium]
MTIWVSLFEISVPSFSPSAEVGIFTVQPQMTTPSGLRSKLLNEVNIVEWYHQLRRLPTFLKGKAASSRLPVDAIFSDSDID